MARKLEESWILVQKYGRQRGLGTNIHGMLPEVVGGPLKAHSCLGRVGWCQLEAPVGLPRDLPNEPREGKSGKEMKV